MAKRYSDRRPTTELMQEEVAIMADIRVFTYCLDAIDVCGHEYGVIVNLLITIEKF